jgi:hypothetical protein
MKEDELLKVCFALAENLMWEKDTSPLHKLPEQLTELSEMTNQFVEIAKQVYYQVEDLPNGEEILFGAIKYLNVQAIPPLRGNYSWFDNSLSTLLEICHPNTGPGKECIPFLLTMQKGIIQCLEWANDDSDEDFH